MVFRPQVCNLTAWIIDGDLLVEVLGQVQPWVVWMDVGREDGGGVSPAEIETVWDALYSQTEMESGDLLQTPAGRGFATHAAAPI